MKHEFSTSIEARAVGYISTSGKGGKTLETYRGIDILILDTSGRNMYGYSFSLGPMIPGINPPHFGESVTVNLTKTENKGGGVGAYTEMFDPKTYEQALIDARACIDRYLGEEETP